MVRTTDDGQLAADDGGTESSQIEITLEDMGLDSGTSSSDSGSTTDSTSTSSSDGGGSTSDSDGLDYGGFDESDPFTTNEDGDLQLDDSFYTDEQILEQGRVPDGYDAKEPWFPNRDDVGTDAEAQFDLSEDDVALESTIGAEQYADETVSVDEATGDRYTANEDVDMTPDQDTYDWEGTEPGEEMTATEAEVSSSPSDTAAQDPTLDVAGMVPSLDELSFMDDAASRTAAALLAVVALAAVFWGGDA